MTTPDTWRLIHAERRALISDLESLPDERWATPSLCSDWTVRQVLGHMVATAKMTPPRFVLGMASAGFRFKVMSARDVARETAGPPGDTLAQFKQLVSATNHPPGPITAMLGEVVLHSEDIRRPLGIERKYPLELLVTVADFYKGSNLLLGSKARISGLTLQATDAAWTTGTGAEVTGPMISLLLAMTGRRAGLPELSGAGVATLRGRM
ncbi:MAG: maleylpyruvate isomerase family mycothiol-dependent enzyme [Candidatus Dormiibacterota bacterium]